MGIHILIYSDPVVFGGHEKTLCDGIAALAENQEVMVSVIVSNKNTRFKRKLAGINGNIEIYSTDFETSRGDVFRALFRTPKVRQVAAEIRKLRPDLAIISQGAIGLSVCGLSGAQLAGVKSISFIPMCHPVSLVREKDTPDVKLQDLFYRWLYRIPDHFLTTNRTASNWLAHYGVPNDRVLISYYGVDSTSPPPLAYEFETIGKRPLQLGIIGRVEYYQKRHDFLIKHIAQHPLIENFGIHVLGDGPDLQRCKQLVAELNLSGQVSFHGWVDDLGSWYKKLDLIVMPSRFEGFPLVVLEAMLFGVPVVASRVDGMEEILPDHWLFPEGKGNSMNFCIQQVLSEDQSEFIKKNRQIINSRLNLKAFKNSFYKNVMQVIEGIP